VHITTSGWKKTEHGRLAELVAGQEQTVLRSAAAAEIPDIWRQPPGSELALKMRILFVSNG